MNLSKRHPAYERLPRRLTISFPIWGLYDIDGKGFYADTDKMVREHVERGFNCIRLDDGAGLMHDADGNPRGKIKIGNSFREFDKVGRQLDAIGGEGYCDPLERLIKLATSCKKYGVYLIFSSWYYLHTYWICHDKALNEELFAIPEEDRFMAFAKFLHYIIMELKKRDLVSVLAFVEIFNEADGLFFVTKYHPATYSDEETAVFRKRHEEAIAWLQETHPDVLFAYDTYATAADLRVMPQNIDVYNFHSYYLWSIYDKVTADSPDCFEQVATPEDVIAAHTNRRPEVFEAGWYKRLSLYKGLKTDMIPTLEARLEEKLTADYEHYREKAFSFADTVKKVRDINPDIRIVSGEGTTYIGSKELLWEEHSEIFWKLVEEVMKKYRETGLWGTVIRTCMGPEDPAWHLIPEKILKLNRIFLED